MLARFDSGWNASPASLTIDSVRREVSFDRMVAETSRLTESLVKLAGKAFQPLSTRATANAQRINNIVA